MVSFFFNTFRDDFVFLEYITRFGQKYPNGLFLKLVLLLEPKQAKNV